MPTFLRRIRVTVRVLQRRLDGPAGRRLRTALQLSVYAILAWRLTHVGWGDVLQSLPTSPLFYALVGLSYLALPVSDVLIYGPWWQVPRAALARASFRKRVYNEDVVDYSGEAAFIAWAERSGVPSTQAFRDVRDNNIVSGAVSLTVTLIAAAVALGTNGVGWNAATGELAAFAAIPLLILVTVLVFLGRRVFALSTREALRSMAINAGRMAVVSTLTVSIWSTAVPGTPLRAWIVLLAAQLLVSRIPLIPAKDLLFVGIGVSLSSTIGTAQAAVAGALLVQVAVVKTLNLMILAMSSLRRR